MISLIDVVRMIKAEVPNLVNVYPLEYPLDSPTESILVDMNGNNPSIAGVFTLNIQIRVRATHPTRGEELSYQIRNVLENKTNFTLGNLQVIMVKSQNPVPLFLGKDESDSYLYSNNFQFRMNEGGNK